MTTDTSMRMQEALMAGQCAAQLCDQTVTSAAVRGEWPLNCPAGYRTLS